MRDVRPDDIRLEVAGEDYRSPDEELMYPYLARIAVGKDNALPTDKHQRQIGELERRAIRDIAASGERSIPLIYRHRARNSWQG